MTTESTKTTEISENAKSSGNTTDATDTENITSAENTAKIGISGNTGTPANTATDAVWTSSTMEREPEPHGHRSMRRTTLTWGLILLVVGGLLIAFGMGLHIDLATTGIVLLGATGLLVLVAAFLPRPRGPRP